MLGTHCEGGDGSGEAPHACCHGLKRKIILRQATVPGKEQGFS